MTPIITDSLTVVTRITREDGRLRVVADPQAEDFSADQLDALRVAMALAQRQIAELTAAEQQAFQEKLAGFMPAPG